MSLANTLAGPAMLAMLAAIPLASLLAARGGRSVLSGMIMLIILFTANIVIAMNVTEFGEFGAVVTIMTAFFSPIILLASWHVGCWLRERRASPENVTD